MIVYRSLEKCILDIHIGMNYWNELLGDSNKKGIIAVREGEAIIKKLGLKSFEGGYKILIMWLPELMNNEAANKLLKSIEEPPKKTLFLLVSNSTDRILDTILSRTQQINFNALSDNLVANKLINQFEINENEAMKLAKLSRQRSQTSLVENQNNEAFLLFQCSSNGCVYVTLETFLLPLIG